jgi:hypothetical protein
MFRFPTRCEFGWNTGGFASLGFLDLLPKVIAEKAEPVDAESKAR